MHKKILKDILKECPDKEGWCFLKEYCENLLDDRTAEQLRLISDYKWLESQREKKDVGYRDAMTRFVDNGFADKFAEIYKEGMTHDELNKKLFG
jgi:hypothetical protein